MGGSSQPEAPDPVQTYEKGIQTDLEFLPGQLDAEASARSGQNALYAQDWLDLQKTYGSGIADIYLNLLGQIDPQGFALRQQMGDRILAGLQAGYSLGPELQRQTEQSIRGAQAARGNILGNSAASAETLYKGQAGIDLYNRRQGDAVKFLTTASPQSQIGIPTVMGTIAPGFEYINPGAGHLAMDNPWNKQAAIPWLQQEHDPWTRAGIGAVTGAEEGWSGGNAFGGLVGGVYGAIGGFIGGAIDGYFDGPIYSDLHGYG